MLSKYILRTSGHLLLLLLLVNAEKNGEVKQQDKMTTPLPFPEVMYVFFTPNQMRPGKVLPFYFGGAFSSKYPSYLSKEKADKIPFSTLELPGILETFGFRQGSKQAEAMEYTLKHCEAKPNPGVVKFCATSLESLVDNVWKNVGPNAKSIKALSSSPIAPKKGVQNYTVVGKPRMIEGSENMLGCHLMTYPYKVYFCHRPAGAVKVMKVNLMGQDGTKMEVVATCHLDTFNWDDDIDAFNFMGTQPGEPVCHVLPPEDLVWVPGTAHAGASTSSAAHGM